MKPTVTPSQIAEILSNSTVEVQTIFGKVTLVSVRLPNGFVLTASSGAVSIENYDEKIGAEICMKQIEDQLWKLEGYALQKRVAAGFGDISDADLMNRLVEKHAALLNCKNRLETIRETDKTGLALDENIANAERALAL